MYCDIVEVLKRVGLGFTEEFTERITEGFI